MKCCEFPGRRIGLLILAFVPLAAAPGLPAADAWQTDQATAGSQTGPAANDESFERAVQLESFDAVWNKIRQTHWDPERVGESWDAAREKFRPRVEQAESIEEVRAALSQLLETLDQSHFGIIPRDDYETIEEEQSGGGEGTIGIEVRLLDDRLVVTRVVPGFPADQAGVRPGWVLTGLRGTTDDEIIERCSKVAEHSVMRLETIVGLATDGRSSGEPGTDISMTFLDGDDQPHELSLTLARAPGQLERLGNLPAFTVDWQARRLDGDIGYVRFNAFIGGPRLAREFARAVEEFHDSRGLVIDLRGNRGGLVALVAGMCGWLVSDRDPIGTMKMAGGTELNLVLNPRKFEIEDPAEEDGMRRVRFDRPVAVLIDECSISAAEIMAGGLRDLEAAEVFGSRTAGLVLPSVVTRLPNGDGFQYAMADYLSASGQTLEGDGVKPTREVRLDRQMLLERTDPVLDAARAWIGEQSDQPPPGDK